MYHVFKSIIYVLYHCKSAVNIILYKVLVLHIILYIVHFWRVYVFYSLFEGVLFMHTTPSV